MEAKVSNISPQHETYETIGSAMQRSYEAIWHSRYGDVAGLSGNCCEGGRHSNDVEMQGFVAGHLLFHSVHVRLVTMWLLGTEKEM